MRLLLLLSVVGGIVSQTGPTDKRFDSPDGRWSVETHWIAGKGFVYKLEDNKTHEPFLDQGPGGDGDSLPKRLDAMWSPNSQFVALTIYYGHAVQEVDVLTTRGGDPKAIAVHLESGKMPLEETLLRPDDLVKYEDYNRLLSGAISWANGTDLVVGVDARIFLKDKKTGEASILDTEWQKTIHCTATDARVIASECENYSLESPAP